MSLQKATSHKLDAAAFRTFIFQGKALFTLKNIEKDTTISFRIQSPKRKRGTPEDLTEFDIYVRGEYAYGRTGYIGRLNRKTKTLRSSGYAPKDHIGIQTINWLIEHWDTLEKFEDDGKLAMYHQGVCCKCGMTLTVPESIENGIGPQCKKYREGNSIKLMEEAGLYFKGWKYEDLVINAIDKMPILIEKLFIPDGVRRTDSWVGQMSDMAELGLF